MTWQDFREIQAAVELYEPEPTIRVAHNTSGAHTNRRWN